MVKNMVSYAGIAEYDLIVALWSAAPMPDEHSPAGIIARRTPEVTRRLVKADLGPDITGGEPDLYIDYYRGKPFKVRLDLMHQEFDSTLYDSYAGEGAAAKVVALLFLELHNVH